MNSGLRPSPSPSPNPIPIPIVWKYFCFVLLPLFFERSMRGLCLQIQIYSFLTPFVVCEPFKVKAMYQVLVTRMLNLRMHCLAPASNLRHKPRMRIAQQKIDRSVTHTILKQRKRSSQIKTAKELWNCKRTVEQELEWRKVERAKNTPPP